MTRPRIGVTLDLAEDGRRYLLKREYADAVSAAGGLPLLLPHVDGEALPEQVAGLDGLLVTGGAFDVPPELYGEARRPGCGPSKPARTEAELAVLRAALAAGLPVLGVCGGMQLLAVAHGATLWQDLASEAGAAGHEQPPPKDVPSHEVQVVERSLLARLVGAGALRVNSTHHQAVREPGRLQVTARAPDGVVEAVELPGHRFALGVQWHPEASLRHEPRHLAIYLGLVAAARERA